MIVMGCSARGISSAAAAVVADDVTADVGICVCIISVVVTVDTVIVIGRSIVSVYVFNVRNGCGSNSGCGRFCCSRRCCRRLWRRLEIRRLTTVAAAAAATHIMYGDFGDFGMSIRDSDLLQLRTSHVNGSWRSAAAATVDSCYRWRLGHTDASIAAIEMFELCLGTVWK